MSRLEKCVVHDCATSIVAVTTLYAVAPLAVVRRSA